MIYYPFSGTVKSNIIDDKTNYRLDYCIDFAITYCRLYGITPDDLRKRRAVGCNTRKKNGVRYDMMRMALSYYLKDATGLPDQHLCKIVGYLTGSSMSKMRVYAKNYIQNKDKFFYPYWEKLLQVA